MLMIRLQRIGRKHEPAFRLVLTDSKNSTKSGKFLEILGNYDARRGEKSEFKSDRITYWMSKGTQVSDTVHNLLIDKKIITGKKINKLPLKKAIVKDVPVVETPKAQVIETPATATNPEIVDDVVETPTSVVEEVPAPTNEVVEEPAVEVGSEEVVA